MTHTDSTPTQITGVPGEVPARRRWSPRSIRSSSRWVHLIGAAVLGTYVYAPDHVTDPMQLPLQIVGIPLLTITGILMWKPMLLARRR
jgi:hypothetical protein